jgi:hypothetical protein
MSKKIQIGLKPVSKPSLSADNWVENRPGETEDKSSVPAQVDEPVEKMKRLTIDIPVSLHRAIKTQCSMRGTKIADEVREILLQKYGNL